jgi:hypothetical protein
MRRMTVSVRETTGAAVRASRMAAIIRQVIVPGVLVGAFLSFIGAFGGGDMPVGLRTAYMIAISCIASAMGIGSFWLADRVLGPKGRWRHAVVAALMMTIPMGLVVWLSEHVVSRSGPPLRQLPAYGAVSLVTSLFFCVAVAGLRGARAAARPSVETAPPRFLDRLPLKLRGAEVWAVEAEDHYLRLHTSRGQDLILMRLADAVAELEGIEGMQVHRSWWIARAAIADAKRGDGRAILTLKDRSEVPVSRTYAGQLRDKGWI